MNINIANVDTKLPKLLKYIFLSLLASPLLYLIWLAASGISKSYGWEVMDWNGDGSTSVMEIMLAADTGERSATWNGLTCVEIFALKDGLPLSVRCGDVIVDRKNFPDVKPYAQ